jgi:hypothetical protein
MGGYRLQKWTLKSGWQQGMDISGSGYGEVVVCCEYYDKYLDSMKSGEFVE